jgi:SAM-dependent methyltransferase
MPPVDELPVDAAAARRLQRRRLPTSPFYLPDWLVRREIAHFVREGLAAYGRGRLLDVGCGEKPYECYAPAAVSQWLGVDVPENVLADVKAYADAVPLPDASFDTVLCTDVLEHVADPAATVREMARLLRPGGVALLTTPLCYPIHEAPYDFWRFTRYGLRQLFEGAGFEIVDMQTMAAGPRAVAVLANTCLFDAGARLPGGTSFLGRAALVPFYVFNNVLAVALATVVRDDNLAIDTAVIARRTVSSQ